VILDGASGASILLARRLQAGLTMIDHFGGASRVAFSLILAPSPSAAEGIEASAQRATRALPLLAVHRQTQQEPETFLWAQVAKREPLARLPRPEKPVRLVPPVRPGLRSRIFLTATTDSVRWTWGPTQR
jgi:hypothetical protein